MPNLIKFHGKHNYRGRERLVLSSDDGTWLNSLPGFINWGLFPRDLMIAIGNRSDEEEARQAFLMSASDYAGAVPTDVLNIIQRVRPSITPEGKLWIYVFGNLIAQEDQWIPSHWERSPYFHSEFCLPADELPIFCNEDDLKPAEVVTKPRSEMSLFELMLEESREKGRQEDAARPANCAFKYL